MKELSAWIFILMLPCVVVPWPVTSTILEDAPFQTDSNDNAPVPTDTELREKVIAVRITSSVAIGRGNGKLSKIRENRTELSPKIDNYQPTTTVTERTTFFTIPGSTIEDNDNITTEVSHNLAGANMEFIKQLINKKQARGLHKEEKVFSFPSKVDYEYVNDTDDSIGESSIKSVLELNEEEENAASEDGVPLARSLPLMPSSQNNIHSLIHKPLGGRENTPILTTVSFNVLHDALKDTSNYNQPMDTYVVSSSQPILDPKFTNQAPKFYNEPAKIYSKPSQVYSEPAKFYSEPAKVYSEPAKVYSEPAKVYSEPAKIYSEPAKFYSQPASLHLTPEARSSLEPWAQQSQSPNLSSTINTTPISTVAYVSSTQKSLGLQAEKNYEVDEKVSVLTDGRSHGVQEANPENCKQENCKVGYVVEGRQYRKYRVEERTSDGFIVGEYGVVRNEDGALRGVRYTADGDASPRLIYDALMKFLQLK